MEEDKSASKLLQTSFEEVQRLVTRCLENLHDAIFELNTERRDQLLELSRLALMEMERIAARFPAISINKSDKEQVRRHIKWLSENDFFQAQELIRKELGSAEYYKLHADSFKRNDHLGRAASLAAKAVFFEVAGDFDAAWACFEKQKGEYLLHSERMQFDRSQTLALVASVFKSSADLLRKEGRHQEALRHYLYFLAHSGKGASSHMKRLPAFLKRAEIGKASYAGAADCIEESAKSDGFSVIDRFIVNATGAGE